MTISIVNTGNRPKPWRRIEGDRERLVLSTLLEAGPVPYVTVDSPRIRVMRGSHILTGTVTYPDGTTTTTRWAHPLDREALEALREAGVQ